MRKLKIAGIFVSLPNCARMGSWPGIVIGAAASTRFEVLVSRTRRSKRKSGRRQDKTELEKMGLVKTGMYMDLT